MEKTTPPGAQSETNKPEGVNPVVVDPVVVAATPNDTFVCEVQEEEEEEEEEEVVDSKRCNGTKKDGTRCTRELSDDLASRFRINLPLPASVVFYCYGSCLFLPRCTDPRFGVPVFVDVP